MEPNKFKSRPLVIQESTFVVNTYKKYVFICGLCKQTFVDIDAVVFNPIIKIMFIFGNHHFCEKCALKLIDNPDKVIFEYKLGLL